MTNSGANTSELVSFLTSSLSAPDTTLETVTEVKDSTASDVLGLLSGLIDFESADSFYNHLVSSANGPPLRANTPPIETGAPGIKTSTENDRPTSLEDYLDVNTISISSEDLASLLQISYQKLQ
jgi:hypothetical protein